MKRWKIYGLDLALLMLLLPTVNLNAEENPRADILAVTQQLFDAVHSRDADDWRAILLAEGTNISFRPNPDGEQAWQEMRMWQNETLMAGIKKGEQLYLERWTGEPTVMIHGPIAVVWGEYDFWIDDQFSHCGVDSIDLVKANGTWKIANIMWTVEQDNCPTKLEGQ